MSILSNNLHINNNLNRSHRTKRHKASDNNCTGPNQPQNCLSTQKEQNPRQNRLGLFLYKFTQFLIFPLLKNYSQ